MKKVFVSVLTIALVVTLLPLFSTNISAVPVTVSGLVADGDGVPLSGVEISATPTTGTAVTATSNATGGFTLPLPDTGTYTFNFEKAGFGLKYSFGALDANNSMIVSGDLTLNIIMGPAYGGIIGYVRNTNGDGLGDATVRIMDGNRVVNHTTTDGNGFYSFDKNDVSDRILIGTYSVHVKRSDHDEQTIHNVEVNDGVNTPIDFVLESREATYILGLDLPHSLMIAGFMIGLFMLIAASIHRKRLGERLLEPEGDGPEIVSEEDSSQNE